MAHCILLSFPRDMTAERFNYPTLRVVKLTPRTARRASQPHAYVYILNADKSMCVERKVAQTHLEFSALVSTCITSPSNNKCLIMQTFGHFAMSHRLTASQPTSQPRFIIFQNIDDANRGQSKK